MLDALRDLVRDVACLTSEATWRTRGRKIAIDAAMIPVPGSAVAQMVALIAFSVYSSACFDKNVMSKHWSYHSKRRLRLDLVRPDIPVS